MRKAILALVFLTQLPGASFAQGCGLLPLTPLTPLGCSRLEPVCVCNDRGECYWQFICVR